MLVKNLLSGIKYVGILLFIFMVFIGCEKTDDNFTPPYDINVQLHAPGVKAANGKNPVGFVKFRQDPDAAKIVNLDTWIFNLEPNHEYNLQRAVNPITDPDCTSTAWLTLGLGLTPETIKTDKKGNGSAALWRDISVAATGTQFRIHFQVIDAASLAVVLTSDCYMYEVR
jgi:hypothetical protein